MKEITNRKKKTMTKKRKLSTSNPLTNNVFIFHNARFGIDLFVNAIGAKDAMQKFDDCQFETRDNWKIMMELPNQPSGGSNES
jgi:hypothetical protein